MLGNINNNPIERELAEAIDQSSTHEDVDTNAYQENEYRNYLHESDALRQMTSGSPLRLSQMNSILDYHKRWIQWCPWCIVQIYRAITTAIAERVIPENSEHC